MVLEKGSLNVAGSLALVSQQTWIFNGTVRDNILMGSEYNSAWYQEVIQACALISDLKVRYYKILHLIFFMSSSSVKEIRLKWEREE